MEILTPALEVTTQDNTSSPKPEVAKEEPKVEDIVSRVSKFTEKPSTPAEEKSSFNRNDIEKIQDPTARKFAEDAYKSLEAGYTKKFQELSSQRKELESLKQNLEAQRNQGWSPERIQQLLDDPTFVKAAQQVTSTQKVTQQGVDLTEEEFNYLTPEQQKVYARSKQVEQTLGNVVGELNRIQLQSEHEKLKGKYANYDSNSVDKLRQDLMRGSYQATSEDIWKVYDYENAIKRAYELGKSDKQSNISEKIGATSLSENLNITSQDEVPKKGPNESFSEYWRRIAKRNMDRFVKR
jgi:hypothetical protein